MLDLEQLEVYRKKWKEAKEEKVKIDGEEKQVLGEEERIRKSLVEKRIAKENDTFDIAVEKLNFKIKELEEEINTLVQNIQSKTN